VVDDLSLKHRQPHFHVRELSTTGLSRSQVVGIAGTVHQGYSAFLAAAGNRAVVVWSPTFEWGRPAARAEIDAQSVSAAGAIGPVQNLLSVSHVTYGLAPPSAAINAHRQMIVTFFNTRVPQLI
jgi:hypothetical protein